MTVTPDTNDLRMTPDDFRHANLIALLLLCAKTLQVAAPLIPKTDSVSKQKCEKQLGSFIYQLGLMYGDVRGLETDTLAMAKELGFNVEQQYLSPEGHA